MKALIKILNNRNTLLVLALVAGLTIGKVDFIKPYTLWILAAVMVFSTTSFNFKVLKDYKFFAKATLVAFWLNYVIFGLIVLFLAKLLIKDERLFWGFAVIIATPPGVAVVPFTFIFKGDTNYSLVAIIGSYLLSIILTPLIIKLLTVDAQVSVWGLVKITLLVVFLPIFLSRLLLLNQKVKGIVEKIRGKVVNWGFAIIVYTVIGANKGVIFNDLWLLLKISVIFFVAMFVSGFVFEILYRKKKERSLRISQNLLLTIKSSGFAAGTALAVFGDRSALPSAIMAIFVLLYLIILGFVVDYKKY